jgi:hypothetical protein
MLDLLTNALAIDPVLVDLIWTIAVSTLLLIGGVISLALLPWSDAEIEAVDHSFRSFWAPVAQRVPAHRS